jgi:[acyl-carrier-protein] S-malonyltransferase
VKRIGILFPGQGAQAVGMGRDLYDSSAAAKRIFNTADAVLERDISKLCFEGPEEELRKTVNTQIAIFVTSLATLEAMRESGADFELLLACGLSLGEFTALVALSAISFEDGLKLVDRRGQLMEEAGHQNPGTMASILGLNREGCEALCAETGAEIANLNSPAQIVISGPVPAIEKACQVAKEKGAQRVIPLKVGGAFHSSLMATARSGLEVALRATQISTPKGIFIPNTTGTAVVDAEEIRSLLSQQLTSSVQWIKTMATVRSLGADELLEVGPGKVLKGLAKKCDSSLVVTPIGNKNELEQWNQPITGGCK